VHEKDARGVGVVGEQHEDQREGDIPVVLQTGDDISFCIVSVELLYHFWLFVLACPHLPTFGDGVLGYGTIGGVNFTCSV
jgi:hypothetical protein